MSEEQNNPANETPEEIKEPTAEQVEAEINKEEEVGDLPPDGTGQPPVEEEPNTAVDTIVEPAVEPETAPADVPPAPPAVDNPPAPETPPEPIPEENEGLDEDGYPVMSKPGWADQSFWDTRTKEQKAKFLGVKKGEVAVGAKAKSKKTDGVKAPPKKGLIGKIFGKK